MTLVPRFQVTLKPSCLPGEAQTSWDRHKLFSLCAEYLKHRVHEQTFPVSLNFGVAQQLEHGGNSSDSRCCLQRFPVCWCQAKAPQVCGSWLVGHGKGSLPWASSAGADWNQRGKLERGGCQGQRSVPHFMMAIPFPDTRQWKGHLVSSQCQQQPAPWSWLSSLPPLC